MKSPLEQVQERLRAALEPITNHGLDARMDAQALPLMEKDLCHALNQLTYSRRGELMCPPSAMVLLP